MLIPLKKRNMIRKYFRKKIFYDSAKNGYQVFEVYFFDWVESVQHNTMMCQIIFDWDFIPNDTGEVATYTSVLKKCNHIIQKYFLPTTNFKIYVNCESDHHVNANTVYKRILWRGRINHSLDYYMFLYPREYPNQLNLFYEAFGYKYNPIRYREPDMIAPSYLDDLNQTKYHF